MGTQTKLVTCSLCSGSGRDIVTPETRTCPKCWGSGQAWETVFAPDDAPAPRRPAARRGGPDAAALFAVILWGVSVGNFVLGADLIADIWDLYPISRETNWWFVLAFLLASSVMVGLAARVFGILVGTVLGIIPLLASLAATRGGIGVEFIVFHAARDSDLSQFLAWVFAATGLFWHVMLSIMVQPPDRLGAARLIQIPRLWHPVRILQIGSSLALAISLAKLMTISLQPYL